MKATLLTLFILPFILGATFESDINPSSNKVVLELFTSQGCSSCPPADELLKEVKSDNVIALSYHVDYWNYIGWKDPFSDAKYTQKQQRYASKFFSSSLYTPQVVVNGKEHFVGSNASMLNQKIESYSKEKSNQSISILDIKRNDNFIEFEYAISESILNNNLRIVLVIDERITTVKRGENRNRTLVNNNIVVAEQVFKVRNTTGKGRLQIPAIVNEDDDLSLVLLIENDNLDIITAVQKAL